MLLTVFTPTYNRRKYLERAYDSLKRQTVKDFMWIIVDDGSSDDTKEYVDKWIEENELKIRYTYVPNGGKMRAHNIGAKMCETELFVCLDSDDYLVDDAVEVIEKEWKIATAGWKKREDSRELGGIIAHKGKSNTDLLSGCEFPVSGYHGLFELYLNGYRGETTLVFKTEVIQKFPFPEIEGEKYVPEDYIYDKIDVEYEYIVLDKIITVCEIVSEGYTDSVIKLKHNNPIAFYMYYEQRAIITPVSALKLKYAGFYVKYAKICGKNPFNTRLPKLYVVMGMLASVLINE